MSIDRLGSGAGGAGGARDIQSAEDTNALHQRSELNSEQVQHEDAATGQRRTDEASEQAGQQLDAAERWRNYTNDEERTVPVSVEQQARDAAQQDADRQEERQRISVAELQAELTMRSGMIRG